MAFFQAGLGSPARPEQLLIALEPEAASVYCRKLRRATATAAEADEGDELSFSASDARYVVVDCGGGTVDITVHEISAGAEGGGGGGQLREVFKATGGPYGSVSESRRNRWRNNKH